MTLRTVTALDTLDPAEWNRLAGDDPFLSHAFLAGLERHGCLEPFGWYPHHVTLWSPEGRLRGAVPFYIKDNSYGEFVFDWDWAEAYQRAGLDYYPKGVVGVPYTPATGARLLLADADDESAAERLIDAVHAQAEQLQLSSVHWNFLVERDAQRLERRGLLPRLGCQYHWQRRDERTFDDLLAGFTSSKRKKIRRERRQAALHGLRIEVLRGDQASEADWSAFHDLYEGLYERKWGVPTLSRDFFVDSGRQLGDRVLLLLAHDGDRTVAAAHCLSSATTLYGRHWGCRGRYEGLHFELCYYQGLEHCLENGLERFEPGAQGEHKIARGFLPVLTRSAHWVADSRFRRILGDHVRREAHAVSAQAEALAAHSPYRTTD